MANVKQGACILCGDNTHLFKDVKCRYHGCELMHSPCRTCHTGVHPTLMCQAKVEQQPWAGQRWLAGDIYVCATINLVNNHPLLHLSNICFLSNNKDHSCISISFNQSAGSINPALERDIGNDQLSNWVQSGTYHTVNKVSESRDDGVNSHFNTCSMLPLVPVTVLSSQLSAIVDTGAVRSLISTTIFYTYMGRWLERKNYIGYPV